MPLQSAPLRSLGSWPLGSGRWHYPAAKGQGELEDKERKKHLKSSQIHFQQEKLNEHILHTY